MATLEKMRHHGVFLLVVVGVALLAFIVGDFLNSSVSIFNEAHSNVAEIDGHSVNATEYMAAIDQLTEVYKIEMGTASLDDELNDQIRESAWETMVRDRLLNAEAEKAGMTVGKKELFDLILGNNIHPIIASRRAFFNPETNAFDPQILSQFIGMLDSEEAAQMPSEQLRTYRQYWKFWETTVKNARLEDKYTALLSRAIVANKLETENAYEGGKTAVDVACVMKPYFAVADSLVNVSDKEAKKLYKERKEQFVQEAGCDLKYVSFAVKPSADDYAEVENWINNLKDEFATSTDIVGVTNSNSDQPYKGINLAKEDVAADLRDFAFKGKKGDVTGPLFDADTYKMARIVETGINRPDSVKLRFVDVAEATMERTQMVADSLRNILAHGGFDRISRQYRGGEAWVREVQIDRDLADKAFTTAVNGTFQMNSMGNIRLFQVAERSVNVPKVKLAVLERKVVPSSRTQAQIFNEAKRFAAACTSIEDLEAKAADQNIEVLSANRLNINANKLQNIKNSRAVIRWAFEAEEGAVSDVFECDDRQVVAAVSRLTKKGYADFEDVKPRLIAELRNDKKAELIEKEMAGKTMAELEAEGLEIDTVRGITFNTPYASTIGNEPKLFALASTAEVGELSQPLQGSMGVFVFTVLDKTETALERDDATENAIVTERLRSAVPYLSYEALKEAADIEDERYKVF